MSKKKTWFLFADVDANNSSSSYASSGKWSGKKLTFALVLSLSLLAVCLLSIGIFYWRKKKQRVIPKPDPLLPPPTTRRV